MFAAVRPAHERWQFPQFVQCDRLWVAVEDVVMHPCRIMRSTDRAGVRAELRDDEVVIGARRIALAVAAYHWAHARSRGSDGFLSAPRRG